MRDSRRERLALPHPANRIVRAAQDEHSRPRIDDLLEAVKVHLPAAIANDQGVLHHPAAVRLHAQGKGIVDGRLDDDAVAGLREGEDRGGQAGEHGR